MLKASGQANRLPFRVFGDRPRPAGAKTLAHRFMAEYGVLLIQPAGPLRASDFDAIALATDLWNRRRGELRGLVVQVREFPGWDNVAGFVRHVQFFRDHQDSIRRIALATDVQVPHLRPELADHFIRADLRRFRCHELGEAIAWASARG
jgi:hypothetical protein